MRYVFFLIICLVLFIWVRLPQVNIFNYKLTHYAYRYSKKAKTIVKTPSFETMWFLFWKPLNVENWIKDKNFIEYFKSKN